MSIIRRRHKNLMIAGSIGFFVALIVIIMVYISIVRGNPEAINWILNDSQLQISEMRQEEAIKVKTYVLLESVEAGTIILKEMLMAMEVDERVIPDHLVEEMETIIGQSATVSIPAKAILTTDFFKNSIKKEIESEVCEVQLNDIPEIIQTGDRINLRVHFPSGQSYLLVGNKEVLHLNTELNRLFLRLNSEELMALSSATEDCNRYLGTKLYLTKLEGVSEEVTSQMSCLYPINPNVLLLTDDRKDIDLLLARRKALDESLTYLFESNTTAFNYENIDGTTLSASIEIDAHGTNGIDSLDSVNASIDSDKQLNKGDEENTDRNDNDEEVDKAEDDEQDEPVFDF